MTNWFYFILTVFALFVLFPKTMLVFAGLLWLA